MTSLFIAFPSFIFVDFGVSNCCQFVHCNFHLKNMSSNSNTGQAGEGTPSATPPDKGTASSTIEGAEAALSDVNPHGEAQDNEDEQEDEDMDGNDGNDGNDDGNDDQDDEEEDDDMDHDSRNDDEQDDEEEEDFDIVTGNLGSMADDNEEVVVFDFYAEKSQSFLDGELACISVGVYWVAFVWVFVCVHCVCI